MMVAHTVNIPSATELTTGRGQNGKVMLYISYHHK